MSKSKYNVKSVTIKGEKHHFVTRGRSKPFSAEEIESFMGVTLEEVEAESPAKRDFKIEGHLRRIFAQDLRSGLEFCSQKYGASPDKIYEEAKRLFPQQNLDKIIGA